MCHGGTEEQAACHSSGVAPCRYPYRPASDLLLREAGGRNAAMHCRAHVTAVTASPPQDPESGRLEPESAPWHAHCSSSGPGQPFDGVISGHQLDSYLGVHAAALKLREQRTELLARNLANADTPGYKAQDLDFRAALAAATQPPKAGTLQRHAGRSHRRCRGARSAECRRHRGLPSIPHAAGAFAGRQHRGCAAGAGGLRRERRALPGHADVSCRRNSAR